MQTRRIRGTLSLAIVVSAMAAIPAPNVRAQTFEGFAPPQTFSAGISPLAVATSDLNGDGVLDLAVVNRGFHPNFAGSVSILLGDGAGSFGPQQTFSAGTASKSVAMGDLNGDGVLDLAVANEGSDDISILLGDGAGAFAPQQTFSAGVFPSSITMGDLNGDGALDLVVVNTASPPTTTNDSSFSVLFGDGAGAFGPPQTHSLGGAAIHSVAIGDLNGDGALDLTIGRQKSSEISVLLGDGAGGFFFGQTIVGKAAFVSITMGDLNGDGALDLALTSRSTTNNFNGGVTIYLGNGDGTFAPPQTFAAGFAPQTIAIGDLNGDGALDIAVTNIHTDFISHGDNFSVLLGDGAGGFTRFVLPLLLQGGYIVASLAMGDFDGDGALDLAVANTGSSTVSILINQTVVCTTSPDLNGNGVVNGADLMTLLSQWGSAGSADLDCNNVVDAKDLATLLANWGSAP